MDIFTEYIKQKKITVKSKRISYKYTFKSNETDSFSSSNRDIFILDKTSDELVNNIMSLFTNNKKAINYIIQNIDERGDFGILFDEDSIRFYVETPFEQDKDIIFSIQLKNNIAIKRVYTMVKYEHQECFNRISLIKDYINKSSMIIRNDGQIYLRLVQNSIPYHLLEQLVECNKMKDWIKNCCEKYKIAWIQICDKSFTLYYRVT